MFTLHVHPNDPSVLWDADPDSADLGQHFSPAPDALVLWVWGPHGEQHCGDEGAMPRQVAWWALQGYRTR